MAEGKTQNQDSLACASCHTLIKRIYRCTYCGDAFRTIQPKTDEKIKECLNCKCPDLNCHEEGLM